MSAAETVTRCGWCDDPEPGHEHYTVMAYENGKFVGRLTPEGGATRKKIFASVLSKERAERIASEINSAGVFTARAAKF